MSNNAQLIMKVLLQTSQPISAVTIFDMTGIPPRSVRAEITKLKLEMPHYDSKIVSKTNCGYQLQVPNHEMREKIAEDYDVYNIVMVNSSSPKERIQRILEFLLSTNNYIKIEEISERLFVSESTILKDMKEVNEKVEKSNLKILRKPYFGIKIEGNEIDKRRLLIEVRLKNTSVYYSSETKESTKDFYQQIRKLHKLIDPILVKYACSLSPITLENLYSYLLIVIERLRDDKNLGVSQAIPSEKHTQIAKEIADVIGETESLDFPYEEIRHITYYLEDEQLVTNELDDNDYTSINDVIYQNILEIHQGLDLLYGFSLSKDEQLMLSVYSHLLPTLKRAMQNVMIVNPLLESIQIDYPFSFKIASIVVEKLNKIFDIDISKDEIAFFALHYECHFLGIHGKRCNVLLVCASGRGTAKLLQAQLKKEYNDYIQIIDTVEMFALETYDFSEIDLILSTVPINKKFPIPVIQLPLFIGRNESELILNEIKEKVKGIDEDIIHLFPDAYTFLNQNFQTMEEVFRFYDEQLSTVQGFNKGELLDDLMEREAIVTTALDNDVAIPHPLKMEFATQFVSLITLKESILWGDKKVSVIFLLMLRKNDDMEHYYKFFIELFKDSQAIKKINHAKTIGEFKDVLRKLEH